jgi:hypothetical protein
MFKGFNQAPCQLWFSWIKVVQLHLGPSRAPLARQKGRTGGGGGASIDNRGGSRAIDITATAIIAVTAIAAIAITAVTAVTATSGDARVRALLQLFLLGEESLLGDGILCVAVQVEFEAKQILKPGNDFIGSRVESRRFQSSSWSTGFNVYSCPTLVARIPAAAHTECGTSGCASRRRRGVAVQIEFARQILNPGFHFSFFHFSLSWLALLSH